MLQLHLLILIILTLSIHATYRECTSCVGTDIWCVNGEDCTINCYACRNAKIYCPRTAHTCNVLCFTNTGIRACENLYIDAVSFKSNTTSLTVNATGHNDIFIAGTIMCPRNNANCDVSCGSDYACRNLVINATNSLYTNVSLTATGLGAFESGRLFGSAFGTINVECSGDQACRSSRIESHPNSLQLDITATGQFVMQTTNIYCPNNGADKNIICNIDLRGIQAMQNGNIYAAEGFYDINFICDPTYHEGCTAVRLWCDYQSGFSYSCSIILNSATVSNVWECSSTAAYCQTFSYPPTQQPSAAPTTSIPTTSIPTTLMPTTLMPTTLMPSTAIPSTLMPSTSMPSTSIPTIAAYTTTIPTFAPSINTSGLYGVEVKIRLQYDLQENKINITASSLENIIANITNELLNGDINNVDDNCIKAKDYTIDVDTSKQIVVINATIYVCDKQTETILIVHYEKMDLETDLVEIIRQNQVLIVTTPDIKIEVDVIKQMEIVSTTINVETSENLHILAQHNDDNLFGIIMAVFGSIVLLCILIVIVICIHHARKDKSLEPSEKSVLKFGNSKSNSKSRERVRSISHEHIETNTNTTVPGEVNKKEDDIRIQPVITTNEIEDANTEIIYSIDEKDETEGPNTEIIIEDSASDEYHETPGNIQYMHSGQRKRTMGGSVDDDRKDNDKILVKEWLVNIDMGFCYNAFIENGYDSLGIIKEMKDKELLIEIGINEKEYIDKLMIEIKGLRQNDNVGKVKTKGFVDGNTIKGNTEGFVDDNTIQ